MRKKMINGSGAKENTQRDTRAGRNYLKFNLLQLFGSHGEAERRVFAFRRESATRLATAYHFAPIPKFERRLCVISFKFQMNYSRTLEHTSDAIERDKLAHQNNWLEMYGMPSTRRQWLSRAILIAFLSLFGRLAEEYRSMGAVGRYFTATGEPSEAIHRQMTT